MFGLIGIMANIFFDYILWHFTIAPFEILRIMKNYLKASVHQFLIIQHFKTLFSPWHRQNPSDFGAKQKTLFDKFFDALADLYIRLIAAVIRLIIIAMGLIWGGILFIGFGILLLIWMIWPVLAVFSVIYGVLTF